MKSAALTACLVVLALPAVAQGPDEDPRALAARAAARIKVLRAEADRLAGQARTVFVDLRKLEVEQSLTTQQLVRATADLAALTRERDSAMKTLADVEARREADTPGLASRLVELYKRGRGGYVRLALSATDVRAFGRTTRGVAALAAVDRARVEAHRRNVAAERDALAGVEQRRSALAASQKEIARARTALDAAVAARNRMIADLDERRDLAAQFVAELEQAQAGLQQTVAALDTPGGAAAALPLRPFQGDLDWPVRGRVSARFGKTTSGRFRTSIVRNGIDIAVAEGTPVRAIHGGVVGYAAPFTGYGTMVIVDHGGGAFSLYGHLADTAVKPGLRVPRGAELGTVGLPPLGPSALYFELRVDGRPVDPLQWLRSSP